MVTPPVYPFVCLCTACAESMKACISLRLSTPMIRSSSTVCIRKHNSIFNFFRSEMSGFFVLVYKRDIAGAKSVLSLWIIHSSFATIERKLFNMYFFNNLALLTVNNHLYPGDVTTFVTSSSKSSAASLMYTFMFMDTFPSLNSSLFLRYRILIPRKVWLSPLLTVSPGNISSIF